MSSITKKASIFIIAAMLLFTTLVPLGAFSGIQASSSGTTDLIKHDAIAIKSNDDIKAVASSGTGTVGDPYVIENLDISATDITNAIDISGTNASLVIRNCNLHDSLDGIHIVSSMNVILQGNTCNNNAASGICLVYNAHNIGISGNICSENTEGLRIQDLSDWNIVSGNTFSNNRNYGVHFDNSAYDKISGNICNNADSGICLIDSCWIDVMFNTCIGNRLSISLFSWGWFCEIGNNACGDGGVYRDWTIWNVNIHDNK